MIILSTFEQLSQLEIGLRVSRISNGRFESYYVAGFLPNLGVLALVSKISVLTAISITCISELEVWFTGYDSIQVGQIMIEQLEHRINLINEVYLSPK